MAFGRWLRNKGFAFTAEQRFSRWEDIGGPGRFEKWALQGPLEFFASKLLNGLAAVAGALVVGWLIPGNVVGGAVATGVLIGTVLGLAVTGKRMWRRDRELYDAWLNKQRRRQADEVAT